MFYLLAFFVDIMIAVYLPSQVPVYVKLIAVFSPLKSIGMVFVIKVVYFDVYLAGSFEIIFISVVMYGVIYHVVF